MKITSLKVTYDGSSDVAGRFITEAAAQGVACAKTELSMERLPPGNTFRFNIISHAGKLYSVEASGNILKAVAVPDNAILPETIRISRSWDDGDPDGAFRAWLDEAARFGCKVMTVPPGRLQAFADIGYIKYKGRNYSVMEGPDRVYAVPH